MSSRSGAQARDEILDSCWDSLKKIKNEDVNDPYIKLGDIFKINELLEAALGKKLLNLDGFADLAFAVNQSDADIEMNKDDVKDFYGITTGISFEELVGGRNAKDPEAQRANAAVENTETAPQGKALTSSNDIKEYPASHEKQSSVSKASNRSPEENDILSSIFNKGDEAFATPPRQTAKSNGSDKENHHNTDGFTVKNENSDLSPLVIKKQKSRRASGSRIFTSTPILSARIKQTPSALVIDDSNNSMDEGNRSLLHEINKLQAIIDSKETDIIFRDELISDLEAKLEQLRSQQQETAKELEKLKRDREISQGLLSELEIKNSSIDKLSKSLKAQETENKRLTAANANLNKEVNELFDKLVNIENLQEKLRADSHDEKYKRENEKLSKHLQSIKKQLTDSTNEKLLEISSLKLKNITIKEELAKVQDELATLRNSLNGKSVVSQKQLREIKDMKLKQLKTLQKLAFKQNMIKSFSGYSLFNEYDGTSNFRKTLISIFEKFTRSEYFVFIIFAGLLVLFFSLINILRSNNDILMDARIYRTIQLDSVSAFEAIKLKFLTLFFPDYTLSRFDYNVDELVRRSNFDIGFYNFINT